MKFIILLFAGVTIAVLFGLLEVVEEIIKNAKKEKTDDNA